MSCGGYHGRLMNACTSPKSLRIRSLTGLPSVKPSPAARRALRATAEPENRRPRLLWKTAVPAVAPIPQFLNSVENDLVHFDVQTSTKSSKRGAAELAEQIAEFLSVPLLGQEAANPPFIPSSFASLRLCARQSLHPGTFDSGCLTANPLIPIQSFLAQRRKGAKFFRIVKSHFCGVMQNTTQKQFPEPLPFSPDARQAHQPN